MNKNIYYTGMICLAITFVAVVFKIMHWPGAGILIITGLGSLALIFLPIAYFKSVKSTDDKLLKFLYTAALISFSIDFIGAIFKILHWPGAGLIMIVGIPLPFILFLPIYIVYHNKRKLKTDMNFFAVLMFMIYLGVFSALLAIAPSYEILTSYALSANNSSDSNKYLSLSTADDGSEISNSTKHLVLQLESIKQKLIVAVDDKNKTLVKPEQNIDFIEVSGKDIKLSFEQLNEAGFDKFNNEFEKHCKMLAEKFPDNNTKRLILEINDYRLFNLEGDNPVIVQIPLISVLNLLSDVQNKLLLISYMQGIKST
jgi:hypothetical protein